MDMANGLPRLSLSLARVALGWVFLWAFLDKLFGLGISTVAGKAWLDGVSPTMGFLSNSKGWLGGMFQGMAGSAFVDWLFMLGLLGLGLALILGIGLRIAAWSGSLLMLLMWLASLPLKTNPIVDDHIVYLLMLVVFARVGGAAQIGLGAWWASLPLVQKYGWLK